MKKGPAKNDWARTSPLQRWGGCAVRQSSYCTALTRGGL